MSSNGPWSPSIKNAFTKAIKSPVREGWAGWAMALDINPSFDRFGRGGEGELFLKSTWIFFSVWFLSYRNSLYRGVDYFAAPLRIPYTITIVWSVGCLPESWARSPLQLCLTNGCVSPISCGPSYSIVIVYGALKSCITAWTWESYTSISRKNFRWENIATCNRFRAQKK